jgi:hypothetical protein
MHFLTLPAEEQLDAIEHMSRADLGEITKLTLANDVMERAETRLFADLRCGDDLFRYHMGYDHIVIKKRSNGPDGHGYDGWSFHQKFDASDSETARAAWQDLCFKAENPEFISVTEGEMVPAETSNFHPVELPPVMEVSIGRAIELVEYSKKFARVSVICAAQAGAEFSSIKGQCERGEWMKVLKLLPFGKSTVYKYIKIADEMQSRLTDGGEGLDLLNLPNPQELLSGDHAELVEQINAVTGEQNLRQLYFEWGIVKQPTPTGGARKVDDKTPQELSAIRREAATQAAQNLCLSIQKICLNETRCIELVEPAILKQLAGDLMDAYSKVRQLEQAG